METTLAERAPRRRAPFFDAPFERPLRLAGRPRDPAARRVPGRLRGAHRGRHPRRLRHRLGSPPQRAAPEHPLATRSSSSPTWAASGACSPSAWWRAVLLVRRRAWTDITLLVASLAGAALLNPLVKQAIARPRPLFHDPSVVTTTYSFPSGHTMGTTAVYTALAIIVARADALRAVRDRRGGRDDRSDRPQPRLPRRALRLGRRRRRPARASPGCSSSCSRSRSASGAASRSRRGPCRAAPRARARAWTARGPCRAAPRAPS